MVNFRRDWMTLAERRWKDGLPNGNASMRLRLLEWDLESLRISLADYFAAQHAVDRARFSPWPYQAGARMFHHAKVFVVCMRRFARLLESAKSKRHEYPREVGDAIDLTWRKSKAFFEKYREARDAIEHIDGEVNGHNWRFLNLWGNQLEVVDGRRADISQAALNAVEKVWADIVAAIMRPVEARVRSALIRILLHMLNARLQQLSGRDTALNQNKG